MNDYIKRVRVPFYEEQLNLVTEAVTQGQLVSGPHLGFLEKWLSEKFRKKYVLLTSNGFSALFLSIMAAVEKTQVILTGSVSTCCAITNAIKAAGHEPGFLDVDLLSAGLAKIDDFSAGTAVISPNHFGIISPLCKKGMADGGILIEDACQSFISRSKKDTASDVVVISFYPTKLINGIDGGAILTDDMKIYKKLKRLRSYEDQYGYEAEPRFNFKMNNVNAAFALGTLTHIDEIEQKMSALYEVFTNVLKRRGIQFLETGADEVASKIIILSESINQKRQWVEIFKRHHIQCGNELFFLDNHNDIGVNSNARRLVERSFSIPFHPLIKEKEMGIMKQTLELL